MPLWQRAIVFAIALWLVVAVAGELFPSTGCYERGYGPGDFVEVPCE